jgi:hypothetical protein
MNDSRCLHHAKSIPQQKTAPVANELILMEWQNAIDELVLCLKTQRARISSVSLNFEEVNLRFYVKI